MARKRVNKNLVAFLTVMGILLTVVVVLIATTLSASQDPEIWATQARERLATEEYQLAADLFMRAYAKSKDVKYLVEAADCCYRSGKPSALFPLLTTARNASDPGTPGHLEAARAYLNYAWELVEPYRYWQLDPEWRSNLLQCAQDLQQADAEDPLGSITEAAARLAMAVEDPQERVQGEAALQRAISLNENAPWVVLTRIQHELHEADARLAKLVRDRAPLEEREKLAADFTQRAMQFLGAAVEANPTDRKLVTEYVGLLQGEKKITEARAVLDRALEQAPEAADLHTAMATFLLWQAREQRSQLSAEEYAALLDEALEHSVEATRLSPGMFQAHIAHVQAELMRDAQQADAPIAPERYEAALRICEQALQSTVGIQSIDAWRGARLYQEALLHIQAFNTAVQFVVSPGQAADREQRMEWVRKFREAIEARYPDQAFTWYVRGLAHMTENDAGNAIQAFENAKRIEQANPRVALYLWRHGFSGILPVHRLAILYGQLNEPGIALNLTEEALRRYAEIQPGQVPPMELCINRAELLGTLNRSQDALDYIQVLRHEYAAVLNDSDRERLAFAEAKALSLSQRGSEAASALPKADTPASLLMQAKLALVAQDREMAAARLQALFAAAGVQPEQVIEGLGLLAPLLTEPEQRQQVRAGLAELRKRFANDAALLRRLDQYDAVLTYTDPEQLDQKLLELIAAEPEGPERARHYFDFYVARERYAEAQKYLDQMEARGHADPTVLGRQFELAVRNEDFQRAEQYAARLAQVNGGAGADNAGGAVFRGQLALARGQAEDAVREFRAAQDALPRSSTLQVQLGQALLAANRVDEALEALREAYDLNPNNFTANVLLDDVYYRRVSEDRRPDDWEKYLEQAARLRPRNQYVVENADRADPQAGIEVREQRRAAEPQNVENLIRLAQLYANKRVGNVERAAERLQEAARLQPGNLEVARAAVQLFGTHGQRAAGEQILAACLEQYSGAERVPVQVLLARFYNLLGDTAAAEQAFATARQMALEKPEQPGQPNDVLLGVELELVNFYRGLPGRARDTITAARWVLDKLNAKVDKDLPRMQFARQAIIRALLELRQLGEAEKEINNYLENFGDDAAGAMLQAQLKLAQRQWQEAYAALTRVLQKAPNHSGALLQRGGLAMRLGMSGEAAADLMKARDAAKAALDRVPAEKRAQSSELKLYAAVCAELATTYEIEEQYELGESTLRQIIDLYGPEHSAQQRETVRRLLRLYERWGRPEKAQQVISEFMARHADDPFWPARLAEARTQQAQKYIQQAEAAANLDNRADEKKYRTAAESEYLAAARYYENAQQLAAAQKQPGHLMFVAFQLDALAAAKRTDRALELFRSLEGQPGVTVPPIVYAAMIRVYQESGQRPQALVALEKAIVSAYREGGGAIPSVMGFAGAHLPADSVATVIRELIKKVPSDSRESLVLHNLLATQLLEMNQATEVLATVEHVLAKAPPNSSERLAAMLARQQALLASGQVDAALAALEEIVRINPDNALVLNNLAYLLVDSGNRPAEALPYAERARELAGSDPSVLDTVGWVYMRNGRHEQAEAALKEALAQNPFSAIANYHLGLLYQAMGRNPAARIALQRALEYAAREKNDELQRKAQEALSELH